MAPLRLQIIVQPRVLPSSSIQAPSEPPIKWLEVCNDDPTIQELSERLEAQFLRRNHAPLNIKILKFLDEVELFPSLKVRDVFEDIKDAKDGGMSLSTVKVYRNPPTSVELADPRRFDSLPPDSLARPFKRPLPPHRPPPPPSFEDAIRKGFHETIDRPDPRSRQLSAGSQAPNKRRRLQSYGAKSYSDNPDQAIESLETVDKDHDLSQMGHERPSPIQQVEDSQTAMQKTRSDPYGTPLSSQIGQQERKRSRDNDVISVPDSPTAQAISLVQGFLRPSTIRDSRSISPELPSSLGRSPRSYRAHTSAHTSNISSQFRQTSLASDTIQAQVPVPLSTDQNVALPASSHPEPLSQSEGAHIGVGSPISPLEHDHTSGLQEPNQTTTPAPPLVRSGAVITIPQETSTAPAPSLKEAAKRPRSKSSGNPVGRLQRPKLLKSPQASPRTCRNIHGLRAKTPSILKTSGVFDPIETSEGSSQERQLLRSAKRSRSNAPRDPSKTTATQKAAKSNSLIVRLQIPQLPESKSMAVPLPEASQKATTTQKDPAILSTQESGSSTIEGEIQEGASGRLRLVAAQDAVGSQVGVSEERAESTANPPEPDSKPSSLDEASQPLESDPSAQRDSVIAKEHIVNTGSDPSRTSSDDTGDEHLEKQLKELQRTKEKAQADFDRITAKRKERHDLRNSRAAPASTETSDVRITTNALVPPGLALSEETKRILSGDDLEAKRNHALEHLVPARKKYFSDFRAAETAYVEEVERQAAKEKEALAQAKRRTRLAKEQKSREDRIAIAERIEAERNKKVQETKARPNTGSLIVSKSTEDAKLAKQKATKEARTKHSTPQVTQPIQQQGLETQRKQDGARVHVLIEAQDRNAKSNQSESMAPTSGQVSRDSSQSKLVERSPKARLNAARQIQLANQVLKHSNHDPTTAKAPATGLASKASKPTIRASKSQQDTVAKQGIKKSSGDARVSEGQRKVGAATHIDQEALKAAGLSAHTPITASTSRKSATTLDTSDSLKSIAPGLPSNKSRQDAQPRSSSTPADRSDPDRVRTMTPAIPSSSMKSNPNSAEARAVARQRGASVGCKNPNTPTRSALKMMPGASSRSVSFAEGPDDSVIALVHGVSSKRPTKHASESKMGGMVNKALEEANAKEGNAADQGSTPVSAGQSSALYKLGKTPIKTKQTTMTQHIDRKLKGKIVNPPSPPEASVEEQIIISSASEASTFYSDESEGERNARAGPSSRKKPKPRDLSVTSTGHDNKTKVNSAGRLTGPRPRQRSPAKDTISEPAKTPNATIVQIDGAPSSPSKRQSELGISSQSTNVSTDDVSNLPPIVDLRQGLPNATLQHGHPQVKGSPKDQIEDPKAARASDEKRAAFEADAQLQREHSQALQAKATLELPPIKSAESSKNVDGRSKQTLQPAKRHEPEKYGSRVRVNAFDSSRLSQLRKEQAAAQMSAPKTAERNKVQKKPIVQPTSESSSASDSESSSSSSSNDNVDSFQEAAAKLATSKKKNLGSVFKDLFGTKDF
ncbi:MAG: hypothetical protein Q9166_003349 [cf. Caloplaca sp. 2 TL-2023]